MTTYSTIQLSESAGIGRITLARPHALNALDRTMCEELGEAAASLARPEIKVVVLTGLGKAFSVGGDLGHFVANKDSLHAELLAMTAVFHRAILTLQRMPAPLFVAVNGVAAGGGFSLVCGGDLVVAKRSAKLVSAYTRTGLTPDGGGSWFLPRIVGRVRAFDLMATNPTLTADEALAIGLVSRVVDDDRFDAEVDAIAASLAALPSGAGQSLKRLLHEGEGRSLEAHLAIEGETLARNASTPETLARLETFLAKSAKSAKSAK